MQKAKSVLEQLAPFFIQTGIGVLLLLIIWQIVIKLPMLAEINFPLDFSIYELLSAVILTIIVILLVHFGTLIELRLNYIDTKFLQSGTIVKLIVFLIALFIAYAAYRPLAVPYLEDIAWVYHLFFLIAFLSLFAMLGLAIYRNSETLTEITLSASQKSKKVASISGGATICNQCGQKNPAGTVFCGFCGKTLNEIQICSKCGSEIKGGAKFCHKCGAIAEESAISSSKNISSIAQCSNCGSQLKSGAKFCISCGHKAEEAKKESNDSLNQCTQCGFPLKQGVKFCTKCGAKTDKKVSIQESSKSCSSQIPEAPICIACQSKLKPGAKFCPFCGILQDK